MVHPDGKLGINTLSSNRATFPTGIHKGCTIISPKTLNSKLLRKQSRRDFRSVKTRYQMHRGILLRMRQT